jgi:myo-inositol-1(or 4)-monophosphatase
MNTRRRSEPRGQTDDIERAGAEGQPQGLRDILAIAVTVARGAGAILREGVAVIQSGDLSSVRTKGASNDIVTAYDHRSEAYIVSSLRAAFPGHRFVGEEGGEYEQPPAAGGPSFEWQIDPLDGTTNFSHGFPIFAVSIGLLVDGIPSVGVVYSPVSDEMYAAALGFGASRNGAPIRASRTPDLQRAMLITGFPYDANISEHNNLREFIAFQRRTQAVRRIGSAALDLCLVACGQMDGYWEMKIKPHDITAGIVIAREAGATVTDFDGGDGMLDSGRIVASNGLIHAAMLDVLRAAALQSPISNL